MVLARQTRRSLQPKHELLSKLLRAASCVHVCTPQREFMPDAVGFDDEYEKGESFEAVYEAISERLILESAKGDLLYAVPGSPLVLERTVELLRDAAASGRVTVEILAAMSFLDVAWARLGLTPCPTECGLLMVKTSHWPQRVKQDRFWLLTVTGAVCYRKSSSRWKTGLIRWWVLQRLGLPDESVYEVSWDDLDREVEADHLTSLWIPEFDTPVAAEFVRFEELVRELRERCPWDRVQTHGSLRKHLLEETYEALEALDARSALDDSEIEADLDAILSKNWGTCFTRSSSTLDLGQNAARLRSPMLPAACTTSWWRVIRMCSATGRSTVSAVPKMLMTWRADGKRSSATKRAAPQRWTGCP